MLYLLEPGCKLFGKTVLDQDTAYASQYVLAILALKLNLVDLAETFFSKVEFNEEMFDLVFCSLDNDDDDVFSLYADPYSAIDVLPYDANILHGVVRMELNGYRIQNMKSLYSLSRPERTACRIKLIPYYAWGNRGLNQMRVWLPESSES